MWNKFGEFSSAEEINQKAAGLLAEGKKDEVLALAEENGIDREMAELFMEGGLDYICDAQTAAFGKLDAELKQYEKAYVANAMETADALKSLMARDRIAMSVHKHGVDIDIDISGDGLAEAVRKKGKALNSILKNVFTRAQAIHRQGNPASAMVVPMVVWEYIRPEKRGKKNG
ncbi:MAG: hypothetical protein NC300_11345 [Bacteroidales bacterium]|nr:hypothetical protein [Clostridium sp.]MCM1204726.1 hypothetical protein [Bacteroidales bacterium]